MRILQIQQGHYRDLTGMAKDEALLMFLRDAEEFLEQHPSARPYHRGCWVEKTVPDESTAPWGTEWYRVTDNGELQRHSWNYDSSD